MASSPVIVIDENVELGSNLCEFLDAEGYCVGRASDLEVAGNLMRTSGKECCPVLVLACNHHRSEALRLWRDGVLGDLHLVVVGTRDPALRSHGRLHIVPLPLDVGGFLRMLDALLPERTGRRHAS